MFIVLVKIKMAALLNTELPSTLNEPNQKKKISYYIQQQQLQQNNIKI